MLIRDSFINYIFLRGAILGLRLVAPASLAYCIFGCLLRPHVGFQWPLSFITALAIAESSFYLLVYLPLKLVLQREAIHPRAPPKDERRALFQKCLETIAEPEQYISGWFLGAPMKQIGRQDVKDFYAWSFLNKKYDCVTETEDKELDHYVDDFERRFDLNFKPGSGAIFGLRGTIEGVYMQHRPLLWYLIVGIVDTCSSIRLLLNGYSFERESLFRASLNIAPTRPLALLGNLSKPAPKISYWYRRHTAKHRLPVVFVHGVGVGMYAYMSFMIQLKKSLAARDGEGDIGIIAVEILPVSARICSPALSTGEMRAEIEAILEKHGWKDFVLCGHSYGTAIASSIIRDSRLRNRVRAAVLLDPICFLLHLPDIAYNFTRRQPTKASEAMVYYFSSRDMMISHTFARRFFWSQAILWKEDVENLPLTVVLSGQDIIVPAAAVWKYLTDSSRITSRVTVSVEGNAADHERGPTKQWTSSSLNLLWFDRYNHADLFDSKSSIRSIIQTIEEYSARQAEN